MSWINRAFLLILGFTFFIGNSATANEDSLLHVEKKLEDIFLATQLDSLVLELLFEADEEPMDSILGKSAVIRSLNDSVVLSRMKVLDGETPLHLHYNPIVKLHIQSYLKQSPRYLFKMLGMTDYYFPIFEEILAKNGLPLELKYLPIVESSLNARAESWMGAKGLWQFMYHTAKGTDLMVSSYVDERSDPHLSTEAACRYLKKLHGIYDDWFLALAAYNGGPGNVNKAIRIAGGKRDYWSIRKYLPTETQRYVPRFIAVNYLLSHQQEHGLGKVQPKFDFFKTDTVSIDRNLPLRFVAEVMEMSLDDIQFLNPSYKIDIIPATENRKYYLRLPVDKIGVWVTNQERLDGMLIAYEKDQSVHYPTYTEKNTRIVHRVKSGDMLGKIANKYKVSVKNLLKWNRLKSDRLKIGQRIVVYVSPDRV